MDDFLKDKIREIVTNGDRATFAVELEAFVDGYTRDLVAFFEAFLRVLQRAQSKPRYYKLFTGLALSAMLYPLLVRLETHGLLDAAVPGHKHTMLDLIEAADVRVYKTGGRSPEKDVYTCAKDATLVTLEDTATRMRNFVANWMGDDAFRARLCGVTYKQNDAGRYILQEYEAEVRANGGLSELTVADLQKMRADDITIEHALAQEPTFSLKGRGFTDDTEYGEQIDRLGNLTLLEQRLNSAASKRTPEQKAASPDLYNKSAYVSTRRFGAEIQGKKAPFGRADVEARTGTLVEFCARRWSL